ncbi:MAG: TRAP transporter permease [Lachnospiraceae bacterium]|nr:TRAP transporter permease [Lachnospiraceae bacterium]
MSEVKNETVNQEELMRQYDKESATRIWTGVPKVIISALTAIFSVYCIYLTLFSTAALEIRLTSFLGLVMLIGYLYYPASKKHVRPNYIPWYDIAIMLVASASFFYYCFTYKRLSRVITSAAKMSVLLTIIGIIAILCIVELCRRCVGLPIIVVAAILVIYSFIHFSIQSPDQSAWTIVKRLMYTLFYSTSGILSTPVQVCAKFIAIFIIFGAFLERTGISNFFISCANALVGSYSGGPAKVAVISSALCGMVSGSSVGNTVTTGSVTIPMMKKTGYKPDFAAAVEAAASTGGQIMPPIMGAAAFLMAEYMGVPYGQVALLAILPAVLYFFGIFIAVHLEAKKLGLKGISRENLPKLKALLPQIYLLIPLVVLVWLVASGSRTLAFSAAIAIILSIIVVLPGQIMDAVKEKNNALTVVKNVAKMTYNSLEAGGRSCVTVVIACCMAGIVAGCITATGLANKLITVVVGLSKSIPNPIISMLICLFLTMICCIILGMGVPTTANYCIMASTCAPILIQMGVNVIAAHFFVFYFGIVADITPPVALAAYAGSAIAKSNPMKTGINATKLAIAAFLVPYVFALNPSMILMDKGVLNAIMVILTSIIGIFGVAAALNGYVFKKTNIIERILFIAGGITLLIPGTLTDIIGIALVALAIVLQIIGRNIQRKKNAA